MDNKNIKEREEISIYSVIQKIKEGTIDARGLKKETRQQCVELLYGEGYKTFAIAQVLKRNEKTIKRDLDEICRRNTESPSIDLAKKIIGKMTMNCQIRYAQLMHLGNNQNASIQEKSQAIYYAHCVEKDYIAIMQSLGYLPSQPQRIKGEILHSFDERADDNSIDAISRELGELKKLFPDTENLPKDKREEIETIETFTNKAKEENKKEAQDE